MLARDIITDEIPPLKLSDNGLKALRWMDEFRVSHMPVVNGKEFAGLITDTDIFDLNSPEEPINTLKIPLIKPLVTPEQHVFDVLKLMAALNLSLIAVVDEQQNYMGSVSARELLMKVSEIAMIREPGGIIVLEIAMNNYTMSQIAQIVEGNDAKILGMYMTTYPDSTLIDITIKVNKEDLAPILQTFYRYNYTVKASFHHSQYTDDMRQRFDEFMNYINI